jgi:hypothetical protein
MPLEGTSSNSNVSRLPPPEVGGGTGPQQPGEGPVRADRPYAAAPNPPVTVQGQVDGPPRESPPLQGRVRSTLPPAVGNPVAYAVDRDARTLNSLINLIESSRAASKVGVDGSVEYGKLPQFATQLIGQMEVIGQTCQLLTGGPAVGEPLQAQMDQLKALAGTEEGGDLGDEASLAAGMRQVRDAGFFNENVELNEAFQKVGAWTNEVRSLAHDRIRYIAQSLESSPLSVSGHYRTRAGINAAAEQMLDDLMAHTHDEGKSRILQEGRDRLRDRQHRLLQAAEENTGQILRSTAEAGVKRLTGLSRLLHPIRAREERTASELYATQLAYGLAAPPLNTPGTNEMSVVEDALNSLLKKAGLSTAYVPHALEQKIQDQIDANPAWLRPVEKQIHLPVLALPDPFAVGTATATSVITPAPALLQSSYEGRGVNSHRSAETTHATNLAHTRLMTAEGTPMFQGIRHGVISAYALTPEGVARMPDAELEPIVKNVLPLDSKHRKPDMKETLAAVRQHPETLGIMRAEANKNRAKEVVALTVMTNPALREAALKGGTNAPITVDLLSVSLLTPDSFRRGTDDNESLMLADQVEAWKAVSGPQTIEIPDSDGNLVEVQVNVNPIAMNYGVNQGAVKGVGGIHVGAVTGWHISDPLNDRGLGALFGSDLSRLAVSRDGVLGERIRLLEQQHQQELDRAQIRLGAIRGQIIELGTTGDDDALALLQEYERAAIDKVHELQAVPDDQSTPLGAALELQRQIAAIHAEGAHRTAGNEPYKMPTRLAVLADLLGVNVAFNCKSGKDRTGELDAEIKHFKLQMQVTGRVPHYARTRTPEEIRHFHEVATNGGNFEIQNLNTGYAGYKLHGVPELFSQFGGQPGDELTQHFHGLSGFTAS